MRDTYDLGVLFLPAVAIFLVTAGVTYRVTRSFGGALTASVLKTALFLVYFSTSFLGTFELLDDRMYIDNGIEFFRRGLGVFNLREHMPAVLVTAQGPHFGYYLYNVYAVSLFGPGYFAPVALNVMLTAGIAALGALVAEREFGFSGQMRATFFYYLLFHAEVVAWSIFINDKDILVLFLHVMLLYGFSLWFQNRMGAGLLLLVPASFLLLTLRFYVPVMFAAAFIASVCVAGRTRRRFYWFFASALIVVSLLMALDMESVANGLGLLLNDLVNPAYGFLYFLLTPIPLNTEPAYAFLNIPAAIHWFLMPFAVIGAYKVYQLGTPFSRFFLIYCATFAALYSLFGELQGPRHRVQLDFAWAVFQFTGLLALVNDARRAKRSAAQTVIPSV